MKEIDKKKLSLKKESLRRLQDTSLEQVVGGVAPAVTAQWWCTSDPCKTDSCKPTHCI